MAEFIDGLLIVAFVLAVIISQCYLLLSCLMSVCGGIK